MSAPIEGSKAPPEAREASNDAASASARTGDTSTVRPGAVGSERTSLVASQSLSDSSSSASRE